jgi:hypothetical protein
MWNGKFDLRNAGEKKKKKKIADTRKAAQRAPR